MPLWYRRWHWRKRHGVFRFSGYGDSVGIPSGFLVLAWDGYDDWNLILTAALLTPNRYTCCELLHQCLLPLGANKTKYVKLSWTWCGFVVQTASLQQSERWSLDLNILILHCICRAFKAALHELTRRVGSTRWVLRSARACSAAFKHGRHYSWTRL